MKRKISILLIIILALLSCNTRAKKEAMQYYTKGRELGMEQKYEEALKMFNQAVETYPDLPEAHNGAGFAYLKMKEYDLPYTCSEWCEAHFNAELQALNTNFTIKLMEGLPQGKKYCSFKIKKRS